MVRGTSASVAAPGARRALCGLLGVLPQVALRGADARGHALDGDAEGRGQLLNSFAAGETLVQLNREGLSSLYLSARSADRASVRRTFPLPRVREFGFRIAGARRN